MYEDIIDTNDKGVNKNYTSVEMCPQCGSIDIEAYPVSAFDVFFYYADCNGCGYKWTVSDV